MKKLDIKNKKLLFELDKNSRLPLTKLAKKLRLSKEVVFHRLNNLIKRGYIQKFQTIISTYRLGYQSYKIYLKLQNINKEIRTKLQNFLLKNNQVYWIGNCQGKWDLIIAIWAKNIQELSTFEDQFLNQFSNYILEKQITITRKSMQYNRRWFYNDKIEPVETTLGEELPKIKLKKIDLEILKSIANNSRIKIIDLTKKLKTTITVIRYRLNNLEKNKVILGYKYALNPKLLNYETCKALISLKNITELKRNQLINYCKLNPNTINIVLTTGSWDMEIEFEVKNFEQYYQIMNNIQEKYKDIIKSYESILISSEPKQVFMPKAY